MGNLILPSQIHSYSLLTGAGFTKNFGGYLAQDMWAQIFNHPAICADSQLKSILRDDFDYESFYYTVTGTDIYSDSQKEIVRKATFDAYQKLDEIVRTWMFRSDVGNPLNIYRLNKFISEFEGSKNCPGFFFTLNQDLFIERRYIPDVRKIRPSLPGVKFGGPNWESIKSNLELKPQDDPLLFPHLAADKNRCLKQIQEEVANSKLVYIKLHGSWNWLSSENKTPQMVIGRGKRIAMRQEPLLEIYYELFGQVLKRQNHKLMIIGYGFGDDHINQVIADAIQHNDLKVHIVNPSSPKAFKDWICKTPAGNVIWEGLFGYYPNTLLDIFPTDGLISIPLKQIFTSMFERQPY